VTGARLPPRLSIVVPALDEALGIATSLARLAPLREAGHEVVVVDGGSRDATPALAAPLADRVLAAPRGRASQMNAGAAVAAGGVLLFLHADTRLPDRADRLILDGLDASGRAWGRFDVRIEGRHRLLRLVGAMMNRRSRWTGIATGDQAMFVRRDAFEAVGGFPPLALMEDIALSARLKRISPPLCVAERAVTSGRRWESQGVARTILLMGWLRLRYFLGASPERLARTYHRPARVE
jgi:rSAM/selenodomain-associated transferase 2